MLCEECQQKEATYTVSMMMGGATTQRHLCADCMARMNMNIASGNMKSLLSAILNALGSSEMSEGEPENTDQPDITCPSCGMTLSRFTKGGRLGCPGCYQAFSEQLKPMLSQLHGRTQHAGRQPLMSEEDQTLRRTRDELTRRLEQAVNQEEYEQAAKLRDQLRTLMAGEVDA